MDDLRSPGNSLEKLTGDRGTWKCQENPPPHPGETLKEDYLLPLGMSVNQLAKDLGVTAARLSEIVRGRRGITAGTALRLARYFNTSPEFWLRLQLFYDLRTAEMTVLPTIQRTVRPRKAA